MTKTRKKLSAILLGAILALGVGAGLGLSNVEPAKAAPETINYEFSSAKWEATPANWTSKKDGLYSATQGVQITTGATGANAISPISFNNITSIVVGYSTNDAKGVGSIKIYSSPTVDGATTQIGSTFSVTKPSSGGTTVKNTTNFITSGASVNGYIKIEGLCTTNSIYIKNISITYEPVPTKALTSIEVVSQPTKNEYYAGDVFDGTGMVVKATYDDESFENVTPVLPTTPLIADQTSVQISYTFGGVTETTTVPITVLANPVTSLVWENPVTSFYEGDLLSLGTGTITATYTNSNTVPLTLSGVDIFVYTGEFDPATATRFTLSTPLTVADHNGKNIKLGFDAVYSNEAVLAITVRPFIPTTTFGGVSTTATLVTDVANLSIGDKILISGVYSTTTYVAGHAAKADSNNLPAIAATKSGNQITGVDASTMQIVTLEAGTVADSFALKVSDGYLYAASSTANQLKIQSSIDANASFKITFSGSNASVISQGSNSRSHLRFNDGDKNNLLFSCYEANKQKAISIYEMDPGVGGEFNYDYLLDILKGGYCGLDLAGLNTLVGRYEAMTAIEKLYFNSATILGLNGETYTGEQALNIAMIKRASLGGLTNKNPFNDTFEQNEIVMVIVIISLIGVSAIAGSLFIFKKKNGKDIQK